MTTDCVDVLQLSKVPACVFAHISDTRDNACGGDKEFVIGCALFGEEGLKIVMDGGEERVEVVWVRVVVAVLESEIFDGIGVEGGGAEHGDSGLMRP